MITRIRNAQVACQLFGGIENHFETAVNRRGVVAIVSILYLVNYYHSYVSNSLMAMNSS